MRTLPAIHVFIIKCLSQLSIISKTEPHMDDKKKKKYVCDVCGYEYDPEVGDPGGSIAPGTAFEDLPDTWVCPLCGVGKDEFSPLD